MGGITKDNDHKDSRHMYLTVKSLHSSSAKGFVFSDSFRYLFIQSIIHDYEGLSILDGICGGEFHPPTGEGKNLTLIASG